MERSVQISLFQSVELSFIELHSALISLSSLFQESGHFKEEENHEGNSKQRNFILKRNLMKTIRIFLLLTYGDRTLKIQVHQTSKRKLTEPPGTNLYIQSLELKFTSSQVKKIVFKMLFINFKEISITKSTKHFQTYVEILICILFFYKPKLNFNENRKRLQLL